MINDDFETSESSTDAVTTLALDTIKIQKQALVFVNTKRSAEKVAEEIAKKVKIEVPEFKKLSEEALAALQKPTKQCERLAKCLEKGIAFHHAGLHYSQKKLVEENFRNGTIKIICSTPTLALGVDLPAFRAIIRDVKRYGEHGLNFIPVLEYLQMAGRAGRPRYDTFGEAISIAQTPAEKEDLFERYIHGVPEPIQSKLAVEPVLRTYLLSLIATGVLRTLDEIHGFFSKTFYAFQYKDLRRLNKIIDRMLSQLLDWEFLQAFESGKFRATMLGRRVAELYIDPLTAYEFVAGLKRGSGKTVKAISLLHLVCNALEMRPLLRVKNKDYDEVQEKLAVVDHYLLTPEPGMYEPDYDDWLNAFKTALMLNDWSEEKDEQYLLEQYDVRPGETRVKLDSADWLLYGLSEIARIMQLQPLLKEILKLRFRLKYGVKEELLALTRLEGIGRVRARKLHNAGIKDLGDVRKARLGLLSDLIGKQVAVNIKKQVGAPVEESDKKLGDDSGMEQVKG